MKRMAHKRNLEKNTRIDEEKQKTTLLENILVQTVRDFTDLSGIVESELDYEIVTIEISRSYLNNGTGITQKQ